MTPIVVAVTLSALSVSISVSPARGQALLYSIPFNTSVPPLYSGQPSAVTTAYLWLDDLLRMESEGKIRAYISSLRWNDTTQTIASNLYQIQDDNPISYYNWDGYGINPYPYQATPGQMEFAFIQQAWKKGGNLPGVLLSSEIIADVTVSGTIIENVVTSYSSSHQVLVNCVINDEIKGKWVPSCPSMLRARERGASPQSIPSVIPVYPDTASAGNCLEFDYSPEWPLIPRDDTHSTSLKDASGGWWIKPGQEYIVFLNFVGISNDTSKYYFSTFPVSFGHEGGMYPVIDGIV